MVHIPEEIPIPGEQIYCVSLSTVQNNPSTHILDTAPV